MKKSLILGILGLAATALPSFGQGVILLDNYNTGGPNVNYGANVPQNGVSGPNGSGALLSGWTVGLYWAAGNQLASIVPDPSGNGVPTGGGLALATGSGSSAQFNSAATGFTPGQFLAGASYTTAGVAGGGTITVELIAYSGADYASAGFRGHSNPFTMTVGDPTGSPTTIGSFMSSFSVTPVPEPATFTLAGLGAAAMLIFRRRR